MPNKCSCGKQSYFNDPGQIVGVCCKICKTREMIDVVTKKCPCGKQPKFNVPGENKGVACSKCKTGDMIDVKSKRCPCGKRPKFNVPGENKGIACSKCKTDEMIDVMSNRCLCGSVPNFNMPCETKGACCSKCKTDDMIDVVHKKCPCGKQPYFNVPGEIKPICCKICKTDEMIDVKSKRCLCGKQPSFNVPGQTKGVCCKKCKTDEMVDVVHQICPGYNTECPVRTIVCRGHEYCMACDPNDARRKLFKRFEEAFFDYAKDKINVHKREFRVTFDQNETSKKYARLDGIVFGDGVIVCIEVDENGHQDYECDEHRMHLVTAELLQKYPEHAVSWVRANPTIGAKNEWSKTSVKKREKRFEDVVSVVKNMLETRDTRVVYIGFEKNYSML